MLLTSCATLSNENPQYSYCGKVNTLEVYRKDYSLVDCEEAMIFTQKAYSLLKQKAGPLYSPWRIEYMWGYISVEEPFARTFNHLIQVQSRFPHAVFHELLHAYMNETGIGGTSGTSQHKEICTNDAWRQAENYFGISSCL
jgi:hypothetical protein